MARTALVAGATGLVGGRLLKLLLDAPEYARVISLGRRELPVAHPKLTQGPLNPVPGCDDVFCSLGTTIAKAGSQEAFRAVDYNAVLNLAEGARASGAKRFFLVSSSGANAKSAIFYSRVKGEIEAAVSGIRFETVYLLRPSLLLGDRGEFRLKEKIGEAVMGLLKPVMIGPARKYRAIEASTVAAAMLALSRRAEKGVHVLESDEIQALG